MEIPGYRIIRELGRGGMAVVYLAEQTKFGREVALKVMSADPSEDSSFQTRFLREARNLAQTSHPNIVTVYDVDVHENYHYFSMEYHTGGDLKERLRKGVSPREALRITREVANALDRAHEIGIIHRDIKPGNIMFARDDRAILTDFGIARNYENETQLTQMGSMVGTPRYMSPEQARGQPLEAASDIYSLGVVLFEMLAGVPPYQAEDSIALGIKHVSAPIPALPDHLQEFQPLIDHLMAKQASERPQSGRELAEELARLEQGLPPSEKFLVKPASATQGADDATIASGAVKTAISRPGQTAAGEPSWLTRPRLISGSIGAVVLLVGAAAFWLTTPEKESTTSAIPLELTTAPDLTPEPDAEINRWLQRGSESMMADRLMTPENDNAVYWYQKVISERPDDQRARNGLAQVAQRYVALARQRLEQGDHQTAGVYADRARQLAPDLSDLAQVDKALAEASAAQSKREQHLSDLGTRLRVSGLLGNARSAEQEGDFKQAAALYREALQLDPANAEAKSGLARVK